MLIPRLHGEGFVESSWGGMDRAAPELDPVRQRGAPIFRLLDKGVENIPGDRSADFGRHVGSAYFGMGVRPFLQTGVEAFLDFGGGVAGEFAGREGLARGIREEIIIHGNRAGVSIHGEIGKRIVLPYHE